MYLFTNEMVVGLGKPKKYLHLLCILLALPLLYHMIIVIQEAFFGFSGERLVESGSFLV